MPTDPRPPERWERMLTESYGLARERMMTGLIVLAPLWLTITVVLFAFRVARNASLWVVELAMGGPLRHSLLYTFGVSPEQWRELGISALPALVEASVATVAVLLTLAAIYAVGSLSTRVTGKRALQGIDRFAQAVPVVSVVYRASKRVMDAVTGEKQAFQRTVLVRWPTAEQRMIGFVTRSFEDAGGSLLHMVFVPSTPNPTTGFLLMIADEDLCPLAWSVDQAVEAVMSGGVLVPDGIPLPSGEPVAPLSPQIAPTTHPAPVPASVPASGSARA